MNKEEIRKKLFTNIENYDQRETINHFYFVSFFNFLLAMAKGLQYQSSWCKKGLFSISQNLERKYSRMDNMMFPVSGRILDIDSMGIGKKDSLLESISDEANYCNLALTFFMLKGKNHEEIKEDINEKFINEQLIFIEENFAASFIEKNYLKEVCDKGISLLEDLRTILNKDEENRKNDFSKFFLKLKSILLNNIEEEDEKERK